ncbi:1,5-anhydro-D-fructose reductase-like [Ixodes scapularis]|uniref:1,5-anhydro-D-fructose reductase-like n=1 Tax=Ixodes scapularis TaxID=6945 RepID=UPI001C3859A7|nr:1,5-anhydro-D-fructose reductase-like [Ixodes scapularis]
MNEEKEVLKVIRDGVHHPQQRNRYADAWQARCVAWVVNFSSRGRWQFEEDLAKLELSVETAVRAGYRHIDTAYSYHCEANVGAALKRLFASGVVKRQELFITSKLPRIAHSRDKVWYYLHKSLEDLMLDYIDLYLIEFPVPGQPGFLKRGSQLILNERDADPAMTTSVDLMETWSGMEDVFNGRITRAIGLSNCNCKQLKRIYDCSKIKPCNLQIECHLYMAQNKTVSFCKNHGVAVTAYAPLGKTSGVPGLPGGGGLGSAPSSHSSASASAVPGSAGTRRAHEERESRPHPRELQGDALFT